MALGGGTFSSQNKVLPGSYINFVNASRAATALSDRGIVAMPLLLDWGESGKVFKVNAEGFQKDCLKVFGYTYDSEEMCGLRDLFKNIRTGYFYRLNAGVKAACTYASAKYGGIRGNDIKIIVRTNVDNDTKFDVITMLDSTGVDIQTVGKADELKDNAYVDFKDAPLELTAGTALTGGTNGEAVSGTEYQAFLNAIESYSFNTLGCLSVSDEIKALFAAFTKRMRDEMGVKFQTVLYKYPADYEGVISVENSVSDEGADEANLVYWVTGAEAGCSVNKSNTNRIYDGEFTLNVDYTQTELEAALKAGKFIFHRVGNEVRVLEDINSFVTESAEKSSDFGSNQSIRVLDQIANDMAVIFNTKYLGIVPNDASGRVSLWNDIVKLHRELQNIRAIENFNADDVVVSAGDTKKAVTVSDVVTPINCMSQLYMTIVVQ